MASREIEFPPRPTTSLRIAIAAIVLIVLAIVALRFRASGRDDAPKTEVRSAPDVVLAVRALAKLETSNYHMEKVIEITEVQKPAWGLFDAKDALLLVAVGDVVAGIDLEKLEPSAVQTDWTKKSVKITLPAPEIFHARLDNEATHVYARTTDTLAKRNEQLESKARLMAEQSMKKAALDAGILGRARTQADRTVRATLKSLGFESVEVSFRQP